jgi:hypothetical protein
MELHPALRGKFQARSGAAGRLTENTHKGLDGAVPALDIPLQFQDRGRRNSLLGRSNRGQPLGSCMNRGQWLNREASA